MNKDVQNLTNKIDILEKLLINFYGQKNLYRYI